MLLHGIVSIPQQRVDDAAVHGVEAEQDLLATIVIVAAFQPVVGVILKARSFGHPDGAVEDPGGDQQALAYHALLFLPLILLGKNRKYTDETAMGRWLPTWKELAQMLLTFVLVTIGWILFRADNITTAFDFIGR